MKFTRNTKYYTGIVYEWNIPTGHSCPYADQCLVKVDRESGKFDNRSNAFRCYAASGERFPSVRMSRWKNYDYVRNGGVPVLPKKCKHVRIHASGDFFSQKYFDMWLGVCRDNPGVEFWAFTKSIGYWVNRIGDIPDNLVLTASYGGRQDDMIDVNGLKSATVVRRAEEWMRIDVNDDIARMPGVDFHLLDNHIRTTGERK